MALIDVQANDIEETWSYPGESDRPAGLNRVVPFEVFANAATGAIARPIGILVTPETVPEQISPYLEQIDLVVVHFPKFRDGRGFSTARALRQRHRFKGEIRAHGHILPDQLGLLAQCGFTSIVTPEDHPPAQWKIAIAGTSPSERPQQLLQRLVKRDIQAPRTTR